MPFFEMYPGTDFSQINLDMLTRWTQHIMKEITKLSARVQELEQHPPGGTSDYDDLTDKPQINSVTLQGNKTASQLGLATPADIPTVITDYDDLTDKPKLNNKVIEGDHFESYYKLQHEIDISTSYPGDVPVLNLDGDFVAETIDADFVGAVPAPSTPSNGDVIMWNGVKWEATNMGTVFNIKGEVATVADLPATGNTVGDVYYVSSVSAGYIWLETTDHPTGYWEELGEPIDLSGYIAKPASPAQNDVLTFDGNDWIAQAPGGGGTERAWTLLQTIDIAQHGSGNITINDLDNFTEFMCFGSKVKNNTSTQSGYTITVNGTDLSQSGVTIAKSTTDQYNWCYIFYDGMFWHVCHHQPTINNNYIAGGNLLVPYFFKENVGKCTTFKLSAPATTYQAVSGTIKIWGR